MLWLVYPIGCALLWGIGYTLLQPVSEKLSSYTINSTYGFILFLTNLIALAISKNFNDFLILKDWKLLLFLCSYIIIQVIGAFIFLAGYNYEDVNAGIYTMISSTYPVITFILSYIFLDQRNINLYYASFGIILTIGGVSLLVLSKNN